MRSDATAAEATSIVKSGSHFYCENWPSQKNRVGNFVTISVEEDQPRGKKKLQSKKHLDITFLTVLWCQY